MPPCVYASLGVLVGATRHEEGSRELSLTRFTVGHTFGLPVLHIYQLLAKRLGPGGPRTGAPRRPTRFTVGGE